MQSLDTPISVLATDLDGTFIPLDGNQANRRDLEILEREFLTGRATLCFVTGRHLESVVDAIESERLPRPDWVICDVGTSIYRCDDSGAMQRVPEYADHLGRIVADLPIDVLRGRLAATDGLRLQEEEKQGPYKLSFYCQAERLDSRAAEIQDFLDRSGAPYSLIASVDPFNGDGLLDLLPAGASKAMALRWWTEAGGYDQTSVVFAGDSGNDLAALCSGVRAIVVANAQASVVRAAQEYHRDQGWTDRLFHATGPATSGVLEGLRHYHR